MEAIQKVRNVVITNPDVLVFWTTAGLSLVVWWLGATV